MRTYATPHRKGLTLPSVTMIIITVAKHSTKKTMTDLLREALAEADSLRAVAKAAGVQSASLVRFVNGKQSLRLDLADQLAEHFGIESKRKAR